MKGKETFESKTFRASLHIGLCFQSPIQLSLARVKILFSKDKYSNWIGLLAV